MQKVARVHGEHDPRLLEIEQLVLDAIDADAALDPRVRELSGNYAVPEWACTSYRRLFAELRAIDPAAASSPAKASDHASSAT